MHARCLEQCLACNKNSIIHCFYEDEYYYYEIVESRKQIHSKLKNSFCLSIIFIFQLIVEVLDQLWVKTFHCCSINLWNNESEIQKSSQGIPRRIWSNVSVWLYHQVAKFIMIICQVLVSWGNWNSKRLSKLWLPKITE